MYVYTSQHEFPGKKGERGKNIKWKILIIVLLLHKDERASLDISSYNSKTISLL